MRSLDGNAPGRRRSFVDRRRELMNVIGRSGWVLAILSRLFAGNARGERRRRPELPGCG
jgi:hypothetical protein